MLHIGGARTALFNWLFARHHGGRFLLRIEDTDLERSTPAAVQAILDGLSWLELDWDGEILYQAQGVERHRALAQSLLERGAAYRCFCTQEELEARRELARQAKENLIYDRACLALGPEEEQRRLAAGLPYTVRFRIPPGVTEFEDRVYGKMSFDNALLEDFIILRSDGTPTYQLAVVADDLEMGITHIIRGDDHVSNTPKQLQIYRALGRPVPTFAHLPLILGADKKRLSKRHGATSVTEYRTLGFLPPAVVNFIALLGWSPGDDREILSRRELVEAFSLEGVSRKSAVFDLTKLEWMNGRYFTAMSGELLLELVRDELAREGLLPEPPAPEQRAYAARALELVRERCRTTGELVERSRFLFPIPLREYDPEAVSKVWKPESRELLNALKPELEQVDEWSEGPLEELLRALAARLGIGAGKLIHPLRLALCGQTVSPGIFETMALMGRALTLARLAQALERLG